MRLPPEILLSAALLAVITAGYVGVAAHGPPPASSLLGHVLGVLGFAAVAVGTFGYSWRKQRDRPGALQHWLQVHVVTGLVGPYLLLLHTAFAFRGVAGLTFLVLLIVVGSGSIGRWVYTRIPKLQPGRRVIAIWWLLHVPVGLAMFALALVHVAGALYYATLLS